jgi:chromosome partition protein MukF
VPSQQDVERVLAALGEQRPVLALETVDLGFLIALCLRGRAAQLTAFGESRLLEVFEQVCEVLEPQAEQRAKRATHAIAKLRQQRMLVRVDGHGVVRSGEYALSRLASGIVEFFLDEDVLTSTSLSLLTGSLQASLANVREAATLAADGGEEAWAEGVVGPLRVTVAELVAGIERRQRGLDLQQEQFQSEIRRLLEADWFEAIERCQSLLEATSQTLRELNEILLRDSARLLTLLHDIEELAAAHGAHGAIEAEQAARQVMEQVDRIVAWGGSRQSAWSEYFQYVHRYLREVVRLDPTRALTQRLRDQLSGRGVRFSLTVAGAGPIRLLRSVVPAVPRPAVSRPRAPREREPVADTGVDAQALLVDRVRGALDAGAATLAGVTQRVNDAVEADEHFVMAGRVAQVAASLAAVQVERERPWVRVSEAIEIEDWALASSERERDNTGERGDA